MVERMPRGCVKQYVGKCGGVELYNVCRLCQPVLECRFYSGEHEDDHVFTY